SRRRCEHASISAELRAQRRAGSARRSSRTRFRLGPGARSPRFARGSGALAGGILREPTVLPTGGPTAWLAASAHLPRWLSPTTTETGYRLSASFDQRDSSTPAAPARVPS